MDSAPVKQLWVAAKCWPHAAPVAAKASLPKTADPDAERPSSASGSSSIQVIRKRSDFLAANRGKRFVAPGFILLVHRRRSSARGNDISENTVRYGITVTKKIGNAVTRNRMKRRFRALLAEALPDLGISGADHIMIGRKQDGERAFGDLLHDLRKGLKHLAKKV